jgi:hypothetical protein
MPMLSFFEMMAPQLKPLLEMATVYTRGIHAYENVEQYFSPYNRQMRAIR